MPDFRNLRQLMSADEMLPRSEDGTFPQYEKMLQNARDKVLQDKYGKFLHGDNDELMSKEANFPSLLQFLQQPQSRIDRVDLNKEIVDSYLRDIHPEIVQNKSLPDRNEEENNDLFRRQIGVGQELSGLPTSEIPERIYHGTVPGLNGRLVLPTENDVVINNTKLQPDSVLLTHPEDFSTAPHEMMHKIHNYLNQEPGGIEHPTDVRSSENLTQSMQDINAGHIPETLNEQKQAGGWQEAPGETAAYYNKFNNMLDQAQRDKFNDVIQGAMPEETQDVGDSGMKISSYADGGQVADNDEDEDQDGSQASFALTNPQDQQAVADSMDADKQRQAKIAAMQQMIKAPMSPENQQMANNMMEGMSMGVTAPVEAGAARVAEGISPELAAKIRNIIQNPSQAIGAVGPMDMGKFQKLRDLMGHVGPVVVK